MIIFYYFHNIRIYGTELIDNSLWNHLLTHHLM